MKHVFLSAFVFALLSAGVVHARNDAIPESSPPPNVAGFIKSIQSDNTSYYTAHKSEFFLQLAKGQYPTATVVSCSDSRVQSNMLSADPEGKLFMVRNIGNQLATTEGSVEYGVHHLHTPVLMFIGHSRCGAISAVNGDYSKEAPAIKRELDNITIGKELSGIEGVSANVHNQVAAAMLKFADELKEGKLTVIGAVLDFADDLHQGAGKLNIINVNGETDAKKLEEVEKLISAAKPSGSRKPKKIPAKKND